MLKIILDDLCKCYKLDSEKMKYLLKTISTKIYKNSLQKKNYNFAFWGEIS